MLKSLLIWKQTSFFILTENHSICSRECHFPLNSLHLVKNFKGIDNSKRFWWLKIVWIIQSGFDNAEWSLKSFVNFFTLYLGSLSGGHVTSRISWSKILAKALHLASPSILSSTHKILSTTQLCRWTTSFMNNGNISTNSRLRWVAPFYFF